MPRTTVMIRQRTTVPADGRASTGRESRKIYPCPVVSVGDVVRTVVWSALRKACGSPRESTSPLKFRAEAYGSRTHPGRRGSPCNGFEDRETHRGPYTSTLASHRPTPHIPCHALWSVVNTAEQFELPASRRHVSVSRQSTLRRAHAGRQLQTAKAECAAVLEAARDMGLLLGKGGLQGSIIRFAPPMCINKADADFMLEVFDRAFAAL